MTQVKRNLGYTIDQTILIVAIIAILITLIIATVGWDLINRSGGTKLAAQMRQIEDAVGQFYAQHQVWPHQATTSGNNANIIPLALANAGTTYYTLTDSVNPDKMKNYIAGFERDDDEINHDFGGTGRVTMRVAAPAAAAGVGSNQYMIIQFADVPINEVLEADEIVDGSEDARVGRLIYRPTGGCTGGVGVDPGTASTVNVCYIANLIQ